jgi:hypothetical protein
MTTLAHLALAAGIALADLAIPPSNDPAQWECLSHFPPTDYV